MTDQSVDHGDSSEAGVGSRLRDTERTDQVRVGIVIESHRERLLVRWNTGETADVPRELIDDRFKVI